MLPLPLSYLGSGIYLSRRVDIDSTYDFRSIGRFLGQSVRVLFCLLFKVSGVGSNRRSNQANGVRQQQIYIFTSITQPSWFVAMVFPSHRHRVFYFRTRVVANLVPNAAYRRTPSTSSRFLHDGRPFCDQWLFSFRQTPPYQRDKHHKRSDPRWRFQVSPHNARLRWSLGLLQDNQTCSLVHEAPNRVKSKQGGINMPILYYLGAQHSTEATVFHMSIHHFIQGEGAGNIHMHHKELLRVAA